MTTAIKRAAVVWACAGTLLLVWSGVTAGFNAGSDSEYEEDVAASVQQQNFWRMVAGEVGATPGVFGKLASDLRNSEIEDLPQFRGDSNRYGGISDELGYDPFNGVNCSECGPLDQEVINRVVDVKSGRLAEVLAELEPGRPDKADGPPGWVWPIWLLSGPGAIGAIYIRQRRAIEERYRDYGGEMSLIRSIDDARAELSVGTGQYNDLTSLRHRLQESIDHRVKYGEEEIRTLKLEALKQEALETLEAITEGNRALGNNEKER